MVNNEMLLFYFYQIDFTSVRLLDRLLTCMHIHHSRFQLTCISMVFPVVFSSDSHLLRVFVCVGCVIAETGEKHGSACVLSRQAQRPAKKPLL